MSHQPPEYDPRRQRPATPPQWQQAPPQPQFRPTAQQAPPPQYQYQPRQFPPPRQPRKPRKGLAFLGCGGLGALVVLIAVLADNGGGSPAAAPAVAAASPSAASSAAVNACYARKPAYGDLVVRDSDPGASVMAQEVGGAYAWDHVTGKCLDAVSWLAATAGQGPGECTTIAKASDNPGYDVNEVPAPPLKDVIESAGPGC